MTPRCINQGCRDEPAAARRLTRTPPRIPLPTGQPLPRRSEQAGVLIA
ncbi:MAG: hypothetical protein K6U89_14125 [Chloroflexi bacterium]|nr:hypothetical protein [Chloroflexota bacterium]